MVVLTFFQVPWWAEEFGLTEGQFVAELNQNWPDLVNAAHYVVTKNPLQLFVLKKLVDKTDDINVATPTVFNHVI